MSVLSVVSLAGVQLPVDEIAVTSAAQIHKLEIILEALNNKLELKESTIKWSVKRESCSRCCLVVETSECCLIFTETS